MNTNPTLNFSFNNYHPYLQKGFLHSIYIDLSETSSIERDLLLKSEGKNCDGRYFATYCCKGSDDGITFCRLDGKAESFRGHPLSLVYYTYTLKKNESKRYQIEPYKLSYIVDEYTQLKVITANDYQSVKCLLGLSDEQSLTGDNLLLADGTWRYFLGGIIYLGTKYTYNETTNSETHGTTSIDSDETCEFCESDNTCSTPVDVCSESSLGNISCAPFIYYQQFSDFEVMFSDAKLLEFLKHFRLVSSRHVVVKKGNSFVF